MYERVTYIKLQVPGDAQVPDASPRATDGTGARRSTAGQARQKVRLKL